MREMAKYLDDAAVLERLRKRQGKRSLRTLATDLELAPSHLSEIYAGKKMIPDAVLEYLKLERRVVYERRK